MEYHDKSIIVENFLSAYVWLSDREQKLYLKVLLSIEFTMCVFNFHCSTSFAQV